MNITESAVNGMDKWSEICQTRFHEALIVHRSVSFSLGSALRFRRIFTSDSPSVKVKRLWYQMHIGSLDEEEAKSRAAMKQIFGDDARSVHSHNATTSETCT